MKMNSTQSLMVLVAGTLCGAGLVFLAQPRLAVAGNEPAPPAGPRSAPGLPDAKASGAVNPRYVAHEWGTFTSVQGSDGVQLGWNPLLTTDLPGFVHDWAKSGPTNEAGNRRLLFSKATAMALQRMETPVIYFYADDPMRVNATVTFPQGTMTEWYPQATWPKGAASSDGLGPRTLTWRDIELLPGRSDQAGLPNLLSCALAPVGRAARLSAFPTEPVPSHYYAARETDADPIRVGTESEKFLFYRGVGQFRAPLTVTQQGDEAEQLTLENTDANEAIGPFFLYQSGPAGARFLQLPALGPGQRRELKWSEAGTLRAGSTATVRAGLGEALERALTAEGLYGPEARAMVKTWEDSWLGEAGLRVLYVLPGAWTDRVLPLTLEPKPAEVVRVMVGRAELITPRMEWDLLREIVRFGGGRKSDREEAIAAVRELGLGRFLDPAVRRLNTRLPSRTFSVHAAELLQAAGDSARATRASATKAVDAAETADAAEVRTASSGQAGGTAVPDATLVKVAAPVR